MAPADPAAFTTVREALAWVTTELTSAGTRAPKVEADMLLEWAIGWSRTRILTSGMDAVPAEAAARLREAVAKRRLGVPVQYITGQAGFYGRLFAVREGCLIPRPETEVLAEAAIQWITMYAPTARVVDLGSGSGALAVTLALECPQTQVTALDLSPEAAAITRHNAETLGADVDVVVIDGFAWLAAQASVPAQVGGLSRAGDPAQDCDPSASDGPAQASGITRVDGSACADGLSSSRGVVQVLVSNPPYIPSDVIAELDAEVRDFEPRLALDGGEDGLDPYRRLAELGDRIFDPDSPAALFLEVGDDQADDVIGLFSAQGQPSVAGEESPAPLWPGWRFWDIADLRGVRRIVAGERRRP